MTSSARFIILGLLFSTARLSAMLPFFFVVCFFGALSGTCALLGACSGDLRDSHRMHAVGRSSKCVRVRIKRVSVRHFLEAAIRFGMTDRKSISVSAL